MPAVEVVGFDATVGFTQWARDASTKNAEVCLFLHTFSATYLSRIGQAVDLLLKAGAIPFAKTNVPYGQFKFPYHFN